MTTASLITTFAMPFGTAWISDVTASQPPSRMKFHPCLAHVVVPTKSSNQPACAASIAV